MMKCVLLYNPNSGKLSNRNEIKRIYKILENYGYETEIIYTEYRGHAKKIVKGLSDVDLLLCAGGDGTLNEVISGNIGRKKPILLGHLPLGSVNDVAHMYGMTNNNIRNIALILNGVQKNIDVCLLNDNPFVYIACIGAFVDISYATPRKLKEKYGKLAYVLYGIKQLKQKLQFYNVKYTVDGVEYEGRYSFIFVSNTNHVGGLSIKNIYDDVKLDDNMFEVLMLDIKNACESVYYLQYEVAYGQIVRGMHHWGASLVIVMMFLHTLRVFFQGAYKKPRELNWIVGVLIFFVMLGLGFTGYLLPWDMKALFATKVGIQIAEQTPLIGPYIKTLLAGHSEIVGAQTLTRFFAIHVFFLPAALLGLMAFHFIMIRKQGISGPL